MPKSSYDEIAMEYYSSGHVTCRNFDLTTKAALGNKPIDDVPGLVLEVGAGRGRANEFLGIPSSQIVQVDNSQAMFALKDREPCLLKVLADACSIPLASQQFDAVVGFLVDPFLGLNSLAEAYRLLASGGKLLFTVPTYEWGARLRNSLHIDLMTTRFRKLETGESVILPSLLHTEDRLHKMLYTIGFEKIEMEQHCLPEGEFQVSKDIEALGRDFRAVPIIRVIRARR